ncbi:cytochrome p450 [Diplodia corticola]|uniref:Cytochrome p450 n=1 Tax=Diplodia corticola TaxID=236234 RepID=A0A1J9RQ41_9PEZI|nr:cytochrome p450 [Diplodia corticola]OJD29677.1 cytochrome p450 [Diplodia corticola]
MATDVPVPVLLVLLAAPEAFLLKYLVAEPNITTAIPVLLAFNCSVWIFWLVIVYPVFFSPLRHLPEPKSGYPHYARWLVLTDKFVATEYLRWIKEVPNNGLIRYRGLFNAETLIPTDPQAYADILVHSPYDFAKPEKLRTFLRRFIGDGLINTEGEEHKFQRKVITPSFSFRQIKELYPTFWSKSVELTQRIAAELPDCPEYDAKTGEGIVDISHWSTKVTLDIIGLAGLGRAFNSLHNHDDPLVALYDEILEPTTEKRILCLLYLYFPDRLLRLVPWEANRRLNLNTERLREASLKLMQEKKQKFTPDGEEQNDILSGLLRTNMFNEKTLIDQLLTILAAGHESTATTFTWACYLLALHPTEQSRLRAELRAADLPPTLSASPSTTTTTTTTLDATLEALPYLNAVCNEVSRLYPAVPIVARTAVRDTQVAGTHVPAGTMLNLVPWAVNRNPALWGADAGDFVPERWLEQTDDGRLRANNHGGAAGGNYAQMTFFHGPRSCVGQRFSMAELRCLVAAFTGRFEWVLGMPEEDVVPGGFVTVKPKGGMRLKVKMAA